MTEERVNAGDTKSVKKQAEKEAERLERERAETAWLLAQPAFRRWFWRWMGLAGVEKSTFVEQPGLLQYRAGQADLIKQMRLELADTDPPAYLLIQYEHMNLADQQRFRTMIVVAPQPSKAPQA